MARLFSMKFHVMTVLSCLAMILLLPANATASLINANVAVSFNSLVNGNFSDNVNVSTATEIQGGDTTNIGTNVLLAGEYIDITGSAIIYHLMGGGTPLSGNPSFLSPGGFIPGDFFKFDNLIDQANANNVISNVSIGLNNVLNNLTVGTDVLFTAHSVQLNLDKLGVLFLNDGLPDFGTITLNLQFQTVNPPPPVPEPESVLLIGVGILLLAVRHRRKLI